MKVKALILVPKDEANDQFLASLPHNVQVQIVDEQFFAMALKSFDDQAARREAAMPPVEEPENPTDEYGDLGVNDTSDGC